MSKVALDKRMFFVSSKIQNFKGNEANNTESKTDGKTGANKSVIGVTAAACLAAVTVGGIYLAKHKVPKNADDITNSLEHLVDDINLEDLHLKDIDLEDFHMENLDLSLKSLSDVLEEFEKSGKKTDVDFRLSDSKTLLEEFSGGKKVAEYAFSPDDGGIAYAKFLDSESQEITKIARYIPETKNVGFIMEFDEGAKVKTERFRDNGTRDYTEHYHKGDVIYYKLDIYDEEGILKYNDEFDPKTGDQGNRTFYKAGTEEVDRVEPPYKTAKDFIDGNWVDVPLDAR